MNSPNKIYEINSYIKKTIINKEIIDHKLFVIDFHSELLFNKNVNKENIIIN